MAMGDDVIYLAYDNPEITADVGTPMLSCRQCRNKTFRIECYEGCAGRVYCAACQGYLGKMGWMPEDEGAGNG